MIYLLIDMPEGRVMVRLGRAAESEFPAPMLRSRMCSTLVDVDVALGPGSVASVVRYGYWKKKRFSGDSRSISDRAPAAHAAIINSDILLSCSSNIPVTQCTIVNTAVS